jgi:hypothetical protein
MMILYFIGLNIHKNMRAYYNKVLDGQPIEQGVRSHRPQSVRQLRNQIRNEATHQATERAAAAVQNRKRTKNLKRLKKPHAIS